MKDMARKATAKKFKLEAPSKPEARSKPKAQPITRITEDECIVNGETLTPGREFQIVGSRDRFVFLNVQFPDTGEPWVNAKDKKNASRAFHFDRIKKVIPLPRPRKGTVEA